MVLNRHQRWDGLSFSSRCFGLAKGRLLPSSPMDRQQHQCLRIQNFLPGLLVAAVDTAPPPWCHLGTLPLDSLSLDEHVDRQALKLISAGCQISTPFHFEVHQFSCPQCFP